MQKNVYTLVSFSSIAQDTETNISYSSTLDLTSAVQLAIEASCFYPSVNDAAVRVKLFTNDVDASWNESADTNPYGEFDIPVNQSARSQLTVPVNPDPKYMRVTVYNQNASYSIDDVTVKAIVATI